MIGMNSWGDIKVGDLVEHVNPPKYVHGCQKSDQTKGEVVRIVSRPYGPSFFIKHEGRKTPIEWAVSHWRKAVAGNTTPTADASSTERLG